MKILDFPKKDSVAIKKAVLVQYNVYKKGSK